MSGTTVLATQSVVSGGKATAQAFVGTAPEGKAFAYRSESEGGAEVDVKTITITATKSFYAVFKDATNTVSFEENGGSAVADVQVPFNTAATKPADPTKAGYTFKGWFSNAGLTTAFDFATPIT